MNRNAGRWILTILSFIISLYLYTVFSYFGVEDFIGEGILKEYFDSNVWHLEILLAGILFGILFILINRLTEKKIFRRRSFGFNILLKTILYIISVFIVFVLIFYLFLVYGLITSEQFASFRSFVSAKFFVSFLVYYVLFVVLMNFIHFVSEKLGQEFLIDLLTGKYYHPRNEELIFMFLDLKGSTMLTEKLGHNAYSNFIKECIHELTPIIQRYDAMVYQYVGDEVVLYWEVKKGYDRFNCINIFFEFSNALMQLNDHFISKYGEAPRFKGGVDAGVVTVTEIGDIKREIAFHGDVLNTAARLEKKCNEFDQQLLITEHVADNIRSAQGFQLRFLSDLPLRGKTQSIKFYSVEVQSNRRA